MSDPPLLFALLLRENDSIKDTEFRNSSRELSSSSAHFSSSSAHFSATETPRDNTGNTIPMVLETFQSDNSRTGGFQIGSSNDHEETESHGDLRDDSSKRGINKQRRPHSFIVWLLTTWLITDPSLLQKYDLPQHRNYQVQNHDDLGYIYICGGRIRTIRQRPVNVACFVAMVVPGVLFYIFDASWIWHHQSPAVVILCSYMWILALSFFVIASTSDAGVLPRNLHLPAGVQDHKLKFVPEEYFNTILLPSKKSERSDVPSGKSNRISDRVKNRIGKLSRSKSISSSPGVTVKYCPTCHIWRPPRASHCGVCNSCVLNHDHHCVFLNNCVGTRNYKYFLWFLLTTVVSCIWLITTSFLKLSQGKFTSEISNHPITFLIGIYNCVGIIYVLLMLMFHIFLTANNITTREYLNYVFGKEGYVNVFDTRSWWRNMYLNWWGTPRSVELMRRRDEYENEERYERVMRMGNYTKQKSTATNHGNG